MNEHIDDHDRATVLSTINMARMASVGVVVLAMGFGMDRSIPITMVAIGMGAILTAVFTRLRGSG